MPFGVKGAPAHFQKVISLTMQPVGGGRVLVYINDILIFGSDVREVWDRTLAVLRALTRQGFMINLRKCKFLTRFATIVG